MTPRRSARATALLAFVGMILAAQVARADDDRSELQRMRFVEHGDSLTLSASIAKLFDSAAYEALGSGFASTVEIQIWVYPKDASEPISYLKLVRSVTYDMWDEQFTVRLEGPRKPIVVATKADALKLLTTIDDLPVAQLADMPVEDIFVLAMRVDLNPVDKKTLTEVRRWLSQGNGGGLDRGGTFFGSFVSVFVNPKIAEADRTLLVHSQPFFRPKQ